MEPIVVDGRVEFADYVAAQRLHRKSGLAWRLIGVLSLLMALLWLAGRFLDVRQRGWRVETFDYAALAYFVYIALIYLVLLPWQYARLYRSHQLLRQDFRYELGEDGLHARSAVAQSDIPWHLFAKWKANSEVALVYQAHNLFHVLPARWFASPQRYQELLKLLGSKLGQG
ncbi:MAG TPA: YcxB family protein [Nevskia sp.]|nr:YcxB family protein [Nevskia sp.]